MAVEEVSGVRVFTCLSGDTKPTSGVSAGSICWEYTAGSPAVMKQWIFNGSAWGLVVTTAAS